MLAFNFCVLSLSFILAGATVSDDKFTALRFGDDGYSLISFQPNMSPLTEKFSFCLWVRKLISGVSPVPFAYEENELFIFDNGNYRLFGVDKSVSSEITVGIWYHYCGTWSLASRTFRVYVNGALAATHITPSGRKLQTGGTLVLGDYWDSVATGRGRTGNHFGGEMYNFNMFSKELTRTEVAELSAGGLCTLLPEQLENYRVIKWEEILKLHRLGYVQNIETGCVNQELNQELKDVKRKLLAIEGELNQTKTGLKDATLKLNETIIKLEITTLELNGSKIKLEGMTVELNETRIDLEDTTLELKNAIETQCALQKGNLTKWDVFYSCKYYDKVFTRGLYKQLRTTWGSHTKTLLGMKITDRVIELTKDLYEDDNCE